MPAGPFPWLRGPRSFAAHERSAAYRVGCGDSTGRCAADGRGRRTGFGDLRPPRRRRRHARRPADRTGAHVRPDARRARQCPVAGRRRRVARGGDQARRGRPDPAHDQPRRGWRRADGRRREPEHAGVGGARRGHGQGRVGAVERGLGRGAALWRRRPRGARAPHLDEGRARAGAAQGARRRAAGPLRSPRALDRPRRRGAPPHGAGHRDDARPARHRAPRGAHVHRRERPVLPEPGDGLLQARARLRRGRAGLAGPHRDRPQRRRGRHPRLRASATSGSSGRPRCPTRRSSSTATRPPT